MKSAVIEFLEILFQLSCIFKLILASFPMLLHQTLFVFLVFLLVFLNLFHIDWLMLFPNFIQFLLSLFFHGLKNIFYKMLL